MKTMEDSQKTRVFRRLSVRCSPALLHPSGGLHPRHGALREFAFLGVLALPVLSFN